MDVPDISRYLKSPNDSLKIQALVSLIEKIEKENNAPGFRKLLDLIFEAAQSSSLAVAESACFWLFSTAEKALKDKDVSVASKDHFKKLDSLFTEVFTRVKKAVHPEFLTKFGLNLVDLQPTEVSEDPNAPTGFHQVFLHFAFLISPDVLENIVVDQIQPSLRLLRLIHADKLPHQLTDILIDQCLEQEENFICNFEIIREKLTSRHYSKLITKNINFTSFWLDKLSSLPKGFIIPSSSGSGFNFKVAEILLNCSKKDLWILAESGFVNAHPAFLLPLFSVVYSNNQISRILKNDENENLVEKFSKIFKDCQNGKFYIEKDEFDGFTTVDKWFNWIVKDEKRIICLIKKWNEWLNSEISKKPNFESLIIIFCLFNYIGKNDLDDFLNILNQSCTEEFQSLILNFHLCHFSSTNDRDIKSKLLLNLPKLKLNDILTKQILKFLYVCSESDFWKCAYISTRKIFEKNDWLFNEEEFQSMIIISKDLKNPDLIEEKFELLKSAALTESGEKLISKIITIVNTRPDLLKKTIEVLINLSKNEMIEIENIKKLLHLKIENDENSLAEYCNFLATCTVDEEEEELIMSCVKELWKLRIHNSNIVKKSAFIALSEFSKKYLIENLENENSELFISGNQVFSSIDDFTNLEVLNGFKIFLKKCLMIDLENIPRKYFISTEKNENLSLFIFLIPVLRDTLQSSGFEWQALALIDPLTKAIMPIGKKSSRCEQILKSALMKIDSKIDLLKKIVIIKNATQVIFDTMMEANLALNKKFGVFDVLKSFTALLSKIVTEAPESYGLCLLCLGFLFYMAQESLMTEAIRDLSKQAFLQDHLESLTFWKKNILDTVMMAVDENWSPRKEVFLKIDKKISSTDKYLACLSVIFIIHQQILKKEEKEQECFDYCRIILESLESEIWKELMLIIINGPEEKLDEMRYRLSLQLCSVNPILAEIKLEKIKNNLNEDLFLFKKDSTNLKEIWEIFLNLTEDLQFKFFQQLAKKTEKLIKLDKSKSGECAEYLADYCIYFYFTTKNRKILPNNFEYLPERSVLRKAYTVLENSKNIYLKKIILESFIGLKKIENETEFQIPIVNWKNLGFHYDENFIINMMDISIEQKNLNLIYYFLNEKKLKISKIEYLKKFFSMKILKDILNYLINDNENIKNEEFILFFKEMATKRFDIKIILMNFMEKNLNIIESNIFEKFYSIPGILERFENFEFDFWKELLKKEKIEIENLIKKYKNNRNLCLLTSWMRINVSEESKIKLLKKIAQLADKIEPDILIEILIGLISASGEVVKFPIEIENKKEILINSFVEKLNFNIELISKILISILKRNLKNERKTAIKAMRKCISLYPACLEDIDYEFFNQIMEINEV